MRGLERVRRAHPGYHAAPVPPLGPARARLLIVGLAPGLHGANRTGRPFTGDDSGALLFEALAAAGLCRRRDAGAAPPGAGLRRTRITNAVKCLPPGNRPSAAEMRRCNPWLRAEIEALARPGVVLALGHVAHRAVLDALGAPRARHPFAHGAGHRPVSGLRLLDSYHCSRYNVRTRRLTRAMLVDVVTRARALLDAAEGVGNRES